MRQPCRLIAGLLAAGASALASGLQIDRSVTCTFDAVTINGVESCTALGPTPGSSDNTSAWARLSVLYFGGDFSPYSVSVGIDVEVSLQDYGSGPPAFSAASYGRGAADMLLDLELTTPGPPRPGVAMMYAIGGAYFSPVVPVSPGTGGVSASIGGYSPPLQSARAKPTPTIVPFDLGVPFEIALHAFTDLSRDPGKAPMIDVERYSSATVGLFEAGPDGTPGAAVPIFITPEPPMAVLLGALLLSAKPAISARRRRNLMRAARNPAGSARRQ